MGSGISRRDKDAEDLIRPYDAGPSLFQHGMSLKGDAYFQREMSLNGSAWIDHPEHGDR